MLGLFASLVDGPVLEVGCGTGFATGELARLGVAVSGLDLSPGMLAVARERLPELRFEVGSMLALPHQDGVFGGVVAWYSTIHVPDPELPTALAELARVLRPGGHLTLVFQTGDEPLHLTSAFGHETALDFHRRQPDHMADLLTAGVPVLTRTVREAMEGERTPHAFLLARTGTRGTTAVRDKPWTVGAESVSHWNRGARSGVLLSGTEYPDKCVIVAVETTDCP